MLAGCIVFVTKLQNESLALCSEGRVAGSGVHPRVNIDLNVQDGFANIECIVPIAIYNRQELHQPPRENLRQDGIWGPNAAVPYEYMASGVTCLANASALTLYKISWVSIS